jgi:hypothetical protein
MMRVRRLSMLKIQDVGGGLTEDTAIPPEIIILEGNRVSMIQVLL